jgi:hypothetical protein
MLRSDGEAAGRDWPPSSIFKERCQGSLRHCREAGCWCGAGWRAFTVDSSWQGFSCATAAAFTVHPAESFRKAVAEAERSASIAGCA